MSNITRIGLAVALVIGSASVGLAQSSEPTSEAQPYRAVSARQVPAAERPNVGPNAPYNYYETSPSQPWSTSMDPANTNGGG